MDQIPESNSNTQKVWPQIMAIGSVSIICISTGMATAWTSPYIPVLIHDKKHFNITEEEASHLPTILYVTVALSSPFPPILADKFGRKYAALMSAIPYFISWILKAFATSIFILYLSQTLQGISECVVYSVLPTYIGEVATPTVRGRFGSAITLFSILGHIFVNAMGTCLTIKQSSFVGALVSVLFFLMFYPMPESPYYLIMKEKEEEAKKALSWLRGTADIKVELSQLKSDVARQMSESGTWKELVTEVANRKALTAGVFLRISQQLSGMTVFIGYTKYIFEMSGSTVSANMSIILFSVIHLVAIVAACYTSEFLERKTYFIFSLIMCSLSIVPITVYFYILEGRSDISLDRWYWVPLASMLSYITFCSFGVGRIPTLMTGELFSNNVKAKGLCVLVVAMGSVMGFVTQMFYYLSSSFGIYTPFALFVGCSMVSAVLTAYVVPDTRGRTLEQIQQLLKKRESMPSQSLELCGLANCATNSTCLCSTVSDKC